jgi:hypothetical protein
MVGRWLFIAASGGFEFAGLQGGAIAAFRAIFDN